MWGLSPPCIAVTFILFRVVLWWPVSFQLFQDAKKVKKDRRPRTILDSVHVVLPQHPDGAGSCYNSSGSLWWKPKGKQKLQKTHRSNTTTRSFVSLMVTARTATAVPNSRKIIYRLRCANNYSNTKRPKSFRKIHCWSVVLRKPILQSTIAPRHNDGCESLFPRRHAQTLNRQ